jgi:hypothetical protein
MTTDGSAMMSLLDQRLDALDRALLGLVSRSERISMVADIEKRVREKSAVDPAEFEALGEVALTSVTAGARESAASPRRRSRLALSSGILGIVAVGLMLLFPFTYLVIAYTADMIGEVPAISLMVANVLAVAGLGTLGGVLSLGAMVRVSRSKKRTRGLGWAITGLCTSPLPALAGLLATVFFVLPLTMEYASIPRDSEGPYVGSLPVSVSQPVDCSNGYCVPPPTFDAPSYSTAAYTPPLPLPPPPANVPYSPNTTGEVVAKVDPLIELKVNATEAAKKAQAAPVVAPRMSGALPVQSIPATPVNRPGSEGNYGSPKPETGEAPMYLPPAEAADLP